VAAGDGEFMQVPPVHRPIGQRPVDAVFGGKAERLDQEGGELRFGHLAGGHGELAMSNRPQAADVAFDLQIVWRIGEHDVGRLAGHQNPVGFRIQGVAAEDAVGTQQPQVTSPRDGGSGERGLVGGVETLFGLVEVLDAEVDFRDVESGDRQIEVEILQS